MSVIRSSKGQAMPDSVVSFGAEAFEKTGNTVIRWMGNAGTFINSRGTTIMIDPLIEGFDMPQLFESPISAKDVPALDAVLVTHIDSDHFSRETCHSLKNVCRSYHAPEYVADIMTEEGLAGSGHDIHSSFSVKDVTVTLTPADHAWQNEYPSYNFRKWEDKDYCGFRLDTPDGCIWMPGDSRLMEEHLIMSVIPDVILFDFSDNPWHISFNGAVKLANTYPDSKLICIHWGTVDAPDFDPFNGDPTKLKENIINPDRIIILRPGEPFILEHSI